MVQLKDMLEGIVSPHFTKGFSNVDFRVRADVTRYLEGHEKSSVPVNGQPWKTDLIEETYSNDFLSRGALSGGGYTPEDFRVLLDRTGGLERVMERMGPVIREFERVWPLYTIYMQGSKLLLAEAPRNLGEFRMKCEDCSHLSYTDGKNCPLCRGKMKPYFLTGFSVRGTGKTRGFETWYFSNLQYHAVMVRDFDVVCDVIRDALFVEVLSSAPNTRCAACRRAASV